MRRIVQVGVGGYGRTWLDTVAQCGERASYAALVDADEAALAAARARTGLPAERCFPTLRHALDTVEADAVLCVVPPAHHKAVIVQALEAGLHVFSDGPDLFPTTEARPRVG